MSFVLSNTVPDGTEIKQHGMNFPISLGPYEIAPSDFAEMIRRVLKENEIKKLTLRNSEPAIIIKSSACRIGVMIGKCVMPLEDFAFSAHYVMTNADLTEDDPWLTLVEEMNSLPNPRYMEDGEDDRKYLLACIRSMKEVTGYNKGNTRLKSEVPPRKPA